MLRDEQREADGKTERQAKVWPFIQEYLEKMKHRFLTGSSRKLQRYSIYCNKNIIRHHTKCSKDEGERWGGGGCVYPQLYTRLHASTHTHTARVTLVQPVCLCPLPWPARAPTKSPFLSLSRALKHTATAHSAMPVHAKRNTLWPQKQHTAYENNRIEE